MDYFTANQGIITIVLLTIAVLGILWLAVRRPGTDGPPAGMVEELARLRSENATLHQQLDEHKNSGDTARRALEEEKIRSARLDTECHNLQSRIEHLTKEANDDRQGIESRYREAAAKQEAIHKEHTESLEKRHGEAIHRLDAEKRSAIEKLERERDEITVKLEARCTELSDRLDKQRDELTRVKELRSTLEQKLSAEEKKYQDLKTELERNREQFVREFKVISSELLRTQGQATTEQQKNALESLLNPFKAEMSGLRVNIKEMNEQADKERRKLGDQIHLMQSEATKLATEANSLAEALRGDKKRQGNWGETILQRVLEISGLVENVHYERQVLTSDDEGNRFIPDVVVKLPGDRHVIIDSKVTLNAYQDMMKATNQTEESAACKRHVSAVRGHIASLSKKNYGHLGLHSHDSVLMFLPVEGALSAALSADPDLIIHAAENRVHLMTPSTLVPTLKIVDHLWTVDSRNKNVDDIVDRAGKLHDKFVSFAEHMTKIGDHLSKASDAQENAMKSLSSGNGNLVRQVQMLEELGARTSKRIPANLVTSAAGDESERPSLRPISPDRTEDVAAE